MTFPPYVSADPMEVQCINQTVGAGVPVNNVATNNH